MPVALSARGLSKRFGEVHAVSGLDLDVARGEILGLLGPNGAGKTTTIRMVAGLLAPTAGRIEVEGRELTPRDRNTRRLVGVCPQENVLYPELTARENLEFAAAIYGVPRAQRRARSDELLAALGLAEKGDVRADRLSGGMRRRLTLAAALVHDPPVVVLDEPEAGLDPQTRVAVREFVRGLARDRAVVLTSHNMDEVDRVARRVAIIDRGRIVAEGTPEELKGRVGSGDHLEIHLENGAAPKVAEALRLAGFAEVRADGPSVTVRATGLARSFPAILATVQDTGGVVRDVRYRGNTLEDVFISLTGRGLRE